MQVAEVKQPVVTIETVSDNNELVVKITNNGLAIDPVIVPDIFELAFTTNSESMGLGLPICRSIIEAHNGQLSLVNNAPGAVTFQFTLPLSQ